MRIYAVFFALLYVIPLAYVSNAILHGINKIFGITQHRSKVPTKPMSKNLEHVKTILAEYEKKRQTEAAGGGKHNIANLNTLKNNISFPEIQMPPITVVIVKDKKALEKYQRKANGSSTKDPKDIALIVQRSSEAPKKA